jgi:hypothetical protein
MSDYIRGKAILFGDLALLEEPEEFPGVVVQCTREVLRDVKRLPMAEDVALVPVSDLEEREKFFNGLIAKADAERDEARAQLAIALTAANAEELRADLAVVSDTNMWDANTPAISTRLRGMLYTQVDITAANKDLHSGLFGGSALNPINLITRILGDLKDEGGEILIPGFYDEVPELPAALLKARFWQARIAAEADHVKRASSRLFHVVRQEEGIADERIVGDGRMLPA